MKTIFIVLITFLVALLTSLLLDIAWISASWVRQVLVVMLIAVEIVLGAMVYIGQFKENTNNQQ